MKILYSSKDHKTENEMQLIDSNRTKIKCSFLLGTKTKPKLKFPAKDNTGATHVCCVEDDLQKKWTKKPNFEFGTTSRINRPSIAFCFLKLDCICNS